MKGDQRWLMLGLLLVVAFAILAALTAAAPPAPDLSVRGDARDGAMALQTWLRRSGYTTREVYNFSSLDDVSVLFVLQPLWLQYAQGDGEPLRRWVAEGGRLIIAGGPEAVNPLLAAFEVELRYLNDAEASLTPGVPSLLGPPFDSARAEAFASIHSEASDLTPHLFSGDLPVLASFTHGEGLVWVAGLLRPFTNRGLHDDGSARLVANLLPAARRGVVIGFDEGGHGYRDPAQSSLGGWLLQTAPGWGVLSAALITFGYLAARGRRFGRALPLPDERLRRDSVEYIQALGSLFRRSGQRAEVLKHYDSQLRRRLSERYGVDSSLPAAELVKAVVYRDPAVDERALRELLLRLAAGSASEHDLIDIATACDTCLRSLP